MVERESLTANVAPGGARNTAEYVDPRNTQEVAMQCCKNLFTRYDKKIKNC
jgi:hypothetical protein